MKINFYSKGDPSVGIHGLDGTIEFNINLPDDEEREELRKSTKQYLGEHFDDNFHVTFEDECGECGKRLINGKCENTACPCKIFD